MFKSYLKILFSSSLLALVFTSCAKYEEERQTMLSELKQANACINKNEELEKDCYDLISYKNSIALLRLGRKAFYKAKYNEAFKRYSLAKLRGNFYTNALLAQMYIQGKGVKKNQKKALELLEEVREDDPIAAYRLSLYYIKQKDYDEAMDLLEFASKNNLKKAQYTLLKLYKKEGYDNTKPEKVKEVYLKYHDKNKDFEELIYGL